jgi:hypothetical protein
MNLRQFERRFKFKRRHDRRQAFRQHRLARSWWSDQQYVMTTSDRDLQSTLRRHLPANLLEVDRVMPRACEYFCNVYLQRWGWIW